MAKILPMQDPFHDVLRYAPPVEETYVFLTTSDPAPRCLGSTSGSRCGGGSSSPTLKPTFSGEVLAPRPGPTTDAPGSGPAVTTTMAAAGPAATATVSASFGPMELVLVAAMIVLAVKLL